MDKRWKYKSTGDDETVARLSRELNINKILANILVQREIDSYDLAKQFFRPSLSDLHDPYLMADMDKATDRISQAMRNNENILIYGDYDVDGTTAVTLVYSYLKEIYHNVDFYLPDRYKEGYGISIDGIDYAYKNNISLIIALDCGIKANDKIEYANSKNVDFIICDHHLPGEELPKAVAILDPKRNDCNYPYKNLSGCGVGFKLMQALGQLNGIPESNIFQQLDLVAISIAADIVEITGENRILAFHGLKLLNEQPRPGIESILEFTNIKRQYNTTTKKMEFSKELTISDLVFTIAPRINAAGRISDAANSVNLLKCKDKEKSLEMADNINNFNNERRTLDTLITEEALIIIENIENFGDHKSTVVYKEGWHKGVLGIVASRLTEHYYRPTIVLSLENGILTGSARSVKGFDIYSAIESCSDLLENFGGHKFAAGMTIRKENIKEFIRRFENKVYETIDIIMETPEIEIDTKLTFNDISPEFYNILRQFAPFGPGNLAPVFSTDGVLDTGYAKVVGANHLKMKLFENGNYNTQFEAIAFQHADKLSLLKTRRPFSICYSIEENNWQGNTNFQIRIKDIK